MIATTPRGTRTRWMRRPLGRTQPSRTSPTGSASAGHLARGRRPWPRCGRRSGGGGRSTVALTPVGLGPGHVDGVGRRGSPRCGRPAGRRPAQERASLSADGRRGQRPGGGLGPQAELGDGRGRHEARGYRPPPDRLHRLTPRCDGSSRCWVPSSWWPWPCSCVRPSIRATTVGAAAGTTPLRSCSVPRSWPRSARRWPTTAWPTSPSSRSAPPWTASARSTPTSRPTPGSPSTPSPEQVNERRQFATGNPLFAEPLDTGSLDRAGAGRPGRPRRRPRGRLRRGRLGLRGRRRGRALGRPRRRDQLGTGEAGLRRRPTPRPPACSSWPRPWPTTSTIPASPPRTSTPAGWVTWRTPCPPAPPARRSSSWPSRAAPPSGPSGPSGPTPRPWRGPPRDEDLSIFYPAPHVPGLGGAGPRSGRGRGPPRRRSSPVTSWRRRSPTPAGTTVTDGEPAAVRRCPGRPPLGLGGLMTKRIVALLLFATLAAAACSGRRQRRDGQRRDVHRGHPGRPRRLPRGRHVGVPREDRPAHRPGPDLQPLRRRGRRRVRVRPAPDQVLGPRGLAADRRLERGRRGPATGDLVARRRAPGARSSTSAAPSAGDEPIADEGTPFMHTPLVIAMPKPMAEALGCPDKPLGWTDILEPVAQRPEGWAAYGHPEWGPFRLGKTNPNFSTSGLSRPRSPRTTRRRARPTGLTIEDLGRARRRRLRHAASSPPSSTTATPPSPSSTTGTAPTSGATRCSYASAVAVEEKSVIDYNTRQPRRRAPARRGAPPAAGPAGGHLPEGGHALLGQPVLHPGRRVGDRRREGRPPACSRTSSSSPRTRRGCWSTTSAPATPRWPSGRPIDRRERRRPRPAPDPPARCPSRR